MAIVKLVDPPTLQASGGTPNHPLKNSQNLSNPLKKCRTIKPAYPSGIPTGERHTKSPSQKFPKPLKSSQKVPHHQARIPQKAS